MSVNYTLAPVRFCLCDVADSVLPELSAPNSNKLKEEEISV